MRKVAFCQDQLCVYAWTCVYCVFWITRFNFYILSVFLINLLMGISPGYFVFCAFTKNNLSFILSWILYYDRQVLISDTNNSLCSQRKMRAFLGSFRLNFFMVNWLDHKKIRYFHNYRSWWPLLQGITLHTFYML